MQLSLLRRILNKKNDKVGDDVIDDLIHDNVIGDDVVGDFYQ